MNRNCMRSDVALSRPLNRLLKCLLLLACAGAAILQTTGTAYAQTDTGEIIIKTDQIPAGSISSGRRVWDDSHQAVQGKIESEAGPGDPAVPLSSITRPERPDLSKETAPGPVQTGTTEKRERPKPGSSISGKTVRAGSSTEPAVKDKKYSMDKRHAATAAVPRRTTSCTSGSSSMMKQGLFICGRDTMIPRQEGSCRRTRFRVLSMNRRLPTLTRTRQIIQSGLKTRMV